AGIDLQDGRARAEPISGAPALLPSGLVDAALGDGPVAVNERLRREALWNLLRLPDGGARRAQLGGVLPAHLCERCRRETSGREDGSSAWHGEPHLPASDRGSKPRPATARQCAPLSVDCLPKVKYGWTTSMFQRIVFIR